MIDDFRGRHFFLSNFYPGDNSSAEHLYQAGKATNPDDVILIMACKTPAAAKKLARKLPLRKDWDNVKLKVMENCLRQKFQITHPDLKLKLMKTYPQELVEGNWWGDVYWGVCNNQGENNLGKLLMQLRREYIEKHLESL